MRLAREFPPDPHAVVYHADERLTDARIDTWVPGGTGVAAPRWATAVLDLVGVRALTVRAYEACVQKRRAAAWCELLPPLESALRDQLTVGLPILNLREVECRSRCFAWHGPALEAADFEGRSDAARSFLAAKIFEIPGVAAVAFAGHRIHVRKGPLFEWFSLTGSIESLIEATGATSG